MAFLGFDVSAAVTPVLSRLFYGQMSGTSRVSCRVWQASLKAKHFTVSHKTKSNSAKADPMDASTLSLSELISRGIVAMNENRDAAVKLRKAGAHAANPPGPAVPVIRKPVTSPGAAPADEAARILAGAANLIEKLTLLPPNSGGEPLLLRRHILHSVEVFLKEISSQR
jgi:hypothetical protein